MGAAHYKGMIVWQPPAGKVKMFAIESPTAEQTFNQLQDKCPPDEIISIEIKKAGA